MTSTPASDSPSRKSRGAQMDPANRFESTRMEKDVPPQPWDDPEKVALPPKAWVRESLSRAD